MQFNPSAILKKSNAHSLDSTRYFKYKIAKNKDTEPSVVKHQNLVIEHLNFNYKMFARDQLAKVMAERENIDRLDIEKVMLSLHAEIMWLREITGEQ